MEIRRALHFTRLIFLRHLSTKKRPFDGDLVLVPDEPVTSKIDESLIPPAPDFDRKLIAHLERLSLVRFTDEEAVANLRESVRKANRLQLINVEGVEPMLTVWEDQDCPLHDDVPEPQLSVKETLANAAKTVEDYFVTPPGNIPLEESSQKLDIYLINQWDKLGVPKPPEPKKRHGNE